MDTDFAKTIRLNIELEHLSEFVKKQYALVLPTYTPVLPKNTSLAT